MFDAQSTHRILPRPGVDKEKQKLANEITYATDRRGFGVMMSNLNGTAGMGNSL